MSGNPRTWPVVEVVDPSTTRGLYIIWAVIRPDERLTVVQAAIVPDDAFSIMAKGIHQWRGYLGRQPVKAIMDCRGGGQIIDKETQETWFDRFRRFGLHYELSVETPMADLHEALRVVWDPESGEARPRMTFTESVARMERGPMWALERFIWTPDRKRATTAEYKQVGKDWVDCLRYLAGFPGLTYRRFLAAEEMPQRQTIAQSYAPPQPLQRRSRGLDRETVVFSRQPSRQPYRAGYRNYRRMGF